MPAASRPKNYIQYHRDGSLWARGKVTGKSPTGYWEWFRKDGTLMRSGHFKNGVPVGTWTTYDKAGRPYKITDRNDGAQNRAKTILDI